MFILDRILRRDRWFTRKQLLTTLNNELIKIGGSKVGETTLRNTLDLIKERAGDHLLEDKGKTGGGSSQQACYRYDDNSFSIYNFPPLDSADFGYLQQALAILRQIKGLDGGTELGRTIEKLQFAVPDQEQFPIIMLDQVSRLRGADYLQDFYEAIIQPMAVAFSYKAFNESEAHEVILHPYLLKEFNNRWYAVGWNPDANTIYPYALDRLECAPRQRSNLQFIEPSGVQFNPTEIFSKIIGMTYVPSAPVHEVHLKFNANRAPYERTKPLHPTQQVVKTNADGSIVFSYKLQINKELIAAILQFGGDAEVLKPELLRKELKVVAMSMLAHYNTVP